MSLKARIRSLEAKVEWLERWGELRKVERLLNYSQRVAQVVDQLTANPTAAARLGVADMIRVRPGRCAGSTLADAIARARARVAAAVQAGPAEPVATGPPKPPPLSELPPEPPPPPELPPKTEAWTHDPPEHLQIEKVTWRRRGPADDFDDDDEDEDDDDAYDAFGNG